MSKLARYKYRLKVRLWNDAVAKNPRTGLYPVKISQAGPYKLEALNIRHWFRKRLSKPSKTTAQLLMWCRARNLKQSEWSNYGN